MNVVSGRAGLRTLVVDQWPLVRGAIADLLVGSGTGYPVGAADSADSAWAMCLESRPDLVITDCDLLTLGDGIRLCGRLKQSAFAPQVLIYSSRNDPGVIGECLGAAADSFVHRSAEPVLLLDAVGQLASGRSTWHLGGGNGLASAHEETLAHLISESHMTSREQEVLGLLLRRYTNEEIAAELYLARQTVKNYVSTVLQKLDVPSRRELHKRAPARLSSPING